MRYAKSFLAAFSVAFAFAAAAKNFNSAPAQDAGSSSITWPDGTEVRVRRDNGTTII